MILDYPLLESQGLVFNPKSHIDKIQNGLVSDIDTGNLLEVVDSHKQQEIIETLNQQSIEARMQVEEVSVDMWAGFPKVVEEVFPNAVVVIDRFPGMKLINTGLNKIRRAAGINQ